MKGLNTALPNMYHQQKYHQEEIFTTNKKEHDTQILVR